jgi:ectoine hydroxylase-related dioxygenase (phytanoyl-CoA dioxygenase family)
VANAPRQIFWIRCTYFISDVTDEMGPFTLLPGSHTSDHVPPDELTDARGQPLPIEGQLAITGPAGSCLINNTEIWHTNMPNTGDRQRRLIMISYKPAWMKPYPGYELSRDFRLGQALPLRRQLCGVMPWTAKETEFPAFDLSALQA